MINRKSESIKLLESIQTNLKESITIDEIEEITQRIESAEDMDEIQQIIYTISDGVLEDEVQNMFDSCNEDDDLDEVKSLVLTTLEDNAEYDESSLKEAETPEAMQKIADKQMPEGGYRYITTHGIGPGTLPKDVSVFKTEDISSGRIAIYISRPLTSEELKQYDIKPEWIQEDSSYRRYKVSFFVDTDSMNNMEIEEKVNELLKGSGLASADETIDVEKVEDLEEDANNFGKAHISKNAKVLAYQVENMGGGTMVIFGKLDDGNYFAGNEEGLIIYDADIRPLYLGEDEVDDKEIEEFDNAHLVQNIDAIDDKELYDMIINQTNYDKY